MPIVHYEPLKTWRKQECHQWSQQHAYQNTPSRWIHMVYEHGKVLVGPKDMKACLGKTPGVKAPPI